METNNFLFLKSPILRNHLFLLFSLLETNNHFLFLRLTLQRNTLHWREDVSLSIKVAQADVKHAGKKLCAPQTTITLLCDTAL